MPLSSAECRALRAQAHSLKPVVQTGGKGLTDAVIAEVDIALETHELIKLRLAGMERDNRRLAAREVAQRCRADLVGTIGAIVILYRPRPEKPVAEERKYAPAPKRASTRRR